MESPISPINTCPIHPTEPLIAILLESSPSELLCVKCFFTTNLDRSKMITISEVLTNYSKKRGISTGNHGKKAEEMHVWLAAKKEAFGLKKEALNQKFSSILSILENKWKEALQDLDDYSQESFETLDQNLNSISSFIDLIGIENKAFTESDLLS